MDQPAPSYPYTYFFFEIPELLGWRSDVAASRNKEVCAVRGGWYFIIKLVCATRFIPLGSFNSLQTHWSKSTNAGLPHQDFDLRLSLVFVLLHVDNPDACQRVKEQSIIFRINYLDGRCLDYGVLCLNIAHKVSLDRWAMYMSHLNLLHIYGHVSSLIVIISTYLLSYIRN